MSMLAAPDTITGPLTAADLDRTTNKGRIWPQPLTGDELHAMFCAIEGGQHADPVPSGIVSMRRHRQTRAAVALAIVLAVTSYLAHIAWPLLG